jgi:hypothetical protein
MSSAPINAEAEAKRLRQTIALAEEAITLACDLRSARHAPGETETETWARWNEAGEIETTAKAARKAARSALAAVKVFPDVWSDEEIAAKIEAARSAALALKAACDAGQAGQNGRSLRIIARDLKRKISEAAAAEILKAGAAEAAALGEANLGASGQAYGRAIAAAAAVKAEAAAEAALALDLGQRREILDLLDQLAGYALEGWEEAGIPEAPEWRKRLTAAQDLLAINTEASAK